MKATRFSLILACACLLASAPLYAQEQSQSSSETQSAAVGQPSSLDNMGIRNYLLGPGDTVDVRVFGQPDFNSVAEVDSDGNISSLPFIEKPIRARCRTEKEVAKDIIAAYSKYLKNPQVSVRITGRNSRPPAIVFGAVRAPSRVEMKRRVRLNEVLTVSGGFTERASGSIQILHTEPVMCPEPGETEEPAMSSDGKVSLQLYKIVDLKAGKESANPFIRPGDVIIVQEAEPVYITGSVVAPQGIYMRDQMTLGRALAMVGGVTKIAKTKEVRIYRQKPGAAGQEIIKVDYAAIRKNQQPDFLLQPYDIIEVPETSVLTPSRLLPTLAGTVLNASNSVISNLGAGFSYRVIY